MGEVPKVAIQSLHDSLHPSEQRDRIARQQPSTDGGAEEGAGVVLPDRSRQGPIQSVEPSAPEAEWENHLSGRLPGRMRTVAIVGCPLAIGFAIRGSLGGELRHSWLERQLQPLEAPIDAGRGGKGGEGKGGDGKNKKKDQEKKAP